MEVFLLSSVATIAAAAVAILWFLFSKREIPPTPNATTNNITSASSSSTTADLVEPVVYEVFLSFCGRDTRKGFTDFLYVDLVAASIITFRDDNELRIGEKINDSLVKAIKESKISIPILSKNYASSKWCLIELAQIVECHRNGGHMIYPVFYDVDPSDVRNQRGGYEKAFRQHKKKFDEETVQSWREALRTVGELKGLELKKATSGHEGELVKIVVEIVLLELKKNYTRAPKNLVGVDIHVEKLKGLLRVDSNGVRVVGIHGMSGLGKTTIAKVIYDQLSQHFERHCFLENVQENLKHHDGILNLQKQLVSKIQMREGFMFSDVNEGRDRMRDAVCGRRVLIVLDDVDESFPVDMLMGNQSWFGAGSRIIITTKNTKVLDVIQITCEIQDLLCYKPDLMDNHHALQLFSKYAFMRDSPIEKYDILSKEVVSTAAGLPLVLVVLGSAFCGEKDIDFWEAKLEKLRVIPHQEVLEKLKISFEVLDYGQKQIFLDIACLFTRRDKTRPCYMWDDCKFFAKEAIPVLVRRSLLTVSDDNVLQMHDQLRDLGRQIVREEGLNELGKQSRLWRAEEAMDVLETRQGTSSVTALCLPVEEYQDRCLVASDFNDLPNLRYLVMRIQDIEGDFNRLFSNLRWLQCTCSRKFEPINLNLKNLVILHLTLSNIENWEGWSQFKTAKKLKVLNLSYSFRLRRIPHLSMFESMERLELQNCRSLCTLDGLEQLKSLTHLDASSCSSLITFPSLSNIRKLIKLDLRTCTKLTEIQGLEKLESLQVLEISSCSSLQRLPTFSKLKKLKTFFASNCSRLIEFKGLHGLISIEELNLSHCGSLKEVPNLSNLKKLKRVDASWLKISEIPGLAELESLEDLTVSYDQSVSRLQDFSGLKCLKKLLILPCENLIEFQGVDGLKSLEDLIIHGCRSLKNILDLSFFKRLKVINISSCYKLVEIQGLGALESLESIRISECTSIERLPNLENLRKLKELFLSAVEKLDEVQGLSTLENLESLYIGDYAPIKRLPGLPNFGMLKSVHLSYCYTLQEVEGLGVIESLEILYISDCDELRETPDLQRLKNLKKLSIRFLEKITAIRGLEKLKFLEVLDINGCTSIEALPDISENEKLIELDVSGCVKLNEIGGLEELKFLKKLHRAGCEVLGDLPDLPNTKIETGYGPASIGPDTWNVKKK